MDIYMMTYDNPEDIGLNEFSVAFVGKPTDERGEFVLGILAKHIDSIITTRYSYDEQMIEVNSDTIHPYDIESIRDFSNENVLIEATTLGTAEIIILTRALRQCGCNKISYIYIEPEKYQRMRGEDVISRRDFEITGVRNSYTPAPGMNYMLEPGKNNVTIIAGFEGERMSQAFEEHDITPEKSSVVFGVPAFNVGWEMVSFANHVNILIENDIKTRHSYCAANNPSLTHKRLEKRYKHKKDTERMFVIPLGTKPQTIGVAGFLSEHYDVGMIYDYPSYSAKSSEGISKCHYFRLEA